VGSRHSSDLEIGNSEHRYSCSLVSGMEAHPHDSTRPRLCRENT
jgi:hypothetical protein